MQLLIFYLTDNRRHFTFPHFINLLNQSSRKDSWKLLVITSAYDEDYYSNELKRFPEIQYDTFRVDPHNNYLAKTKYAIHYGEKYQIPYLMKCDNDLFIKPDTLDAMVDNLGLLDDPANLTIGPVLTSGIPGIEYFKDQFLNQDAQTKIERMFLNTVFGEGYGANYTFLNKHTIAASEWKKEDFFESVKHMDHYYKGIHPIRVNEESLQFLNDYIIEHKEDFFKNRDLGIIYDNTSPYLCNSVYCIRCDTYKTIIFDDSLYVDVYDEVPLNKYCWKNGLNHLFIKNGFAIHMYYNWKPNHVEYEKDFCERFFRNS